jgi:PilZ domain
MFQSARALFRRLGGSGEDRRAHRRHAADVVTVCRTVGTQGEWQARIRDVSRTGISLVVPHFLSAGSMIRVDLPGPPDGPHTTVLACVMYCRELGEGQRVLGCVFSLELSDAEMKQFDGEKTEAEPSDLRAWVRYPTRGTIHYRVLPDEVGEPKAGELVNLSPAGVGLMLDERVEPGSALNISFDDTIDLPERTLLACVVYLSERPDGKFAAGCHFLSELSEKDLNELVERLAT